MGGVFSCCTMEQRGVGGSQANEVVIDQKAHSELGEQQATCTAMIRRDLTPIRDFGSEDEEEEDKEGMPPVTEQKGQMLHVEEAAIEEIEWVRQ